MTDAEGDCVFCRVASGEQADEILFEDDHTVALLDRFRQPSLGGHCLIIPRHHYPTVLDLPEAECGYMMRTSRRVALAVQEALSPRGIRMWMANGRAAGQTIFHLHMHVLPIDSAWDRTRYRVPKLLWRSQPSERDLREGGAAIRDRLRQLA